MTEIAQRLRTELAALPRQDRAELAQLLLHSLDDDAEEGDESWDTELARRMEEIRNGRAAGEPADSVFSQLRERYS